MIAAQLVIDNVKKELGSFFSNEAHKAPDMIRYVNSWVKKIVTDKNFWFNKYDQTVTTSAATDTYSIPFQIETFFVLDEEWDEIEIMEFEDYYREKDKTDIIWIWGETLVTEKIWTFQIFYRGYPNQITAITDTIEIPSHFFDMLVVAASYYGFLDIRSYNKAAEKENIFKWMIKSQATRASDPKPLKTKRLNKSKNKVF